MSDVKISFDMPEYCIDTNGKGTLYLLDNNKPDKIETTRKNNVQKCIQWCIKHKLPYNKNVQQLNVFLPN